MTKTREEYIRCEFAKDLKALLVKYNVEIEAQDHWEGYPECGQDVRMTVLFNDWEVENIDLGSYVDIDHEIDCKSRS